MSPKGPPSFFKNILQQTEFSKSRKCPPKGFLSLRYSADFRRSRLIYLMLSSEKGAMYSFTAGETDPGRGPVWLDNMDCDGTESRINQCGNNGWGISNCRHSEDVGVACRS